MADTAYNLKTSKLNLWDGIPWPKRYFESYFVWILAVTMFVFGAVSDEFSKFLWFAFLSCTLIMWTVISKSLPRKLIDREGELYLQRGLWRKRLGRGPFSLCFYEHRGFFSVVLLSQGDVIAKLSMPKSERRAIANRICDWAADKSWKLSYHENSPWAQVTVSRWVFVTTLLDPNWPERKPLPEWSKKIFIAATASIAIPCLLITAACTWAACLGKVDMLILAVFFAPLGTICGLIALSNWRNLRNQHRD